MKKGRIVEIYFGEEIGGENYWQMQGEFVVTASGVTYDQGHPKMTVQCEDPSTFWDERVVTATPGYRGTAISEILSGYHGRYSGLWFERLCGTYLDKLHTFYCQWVDETVDNIFKAIETHFGAFRHWGTDGKFRMKLIDLDSIADHIYSDLTKIHNYSPEDKYSSFINRVIVKCQGIEPMEVLWDEERVQQLSDTLGWWSKEETITVWYSHDRTRRCRYPRLDVIASINDYSPLIRLLGGKGSESITYEDPDETYCIITIEAPDRAIYVLAFAAIVIALGYEAAGCGTFFGGPCGPYIFSTNLALGALIETISAVAGYRYDLWARPLGHEYESYQGQWDDEEMQTFMGGQVIPYEFEDPLSYKVQHCNMVAANEGDVLTAQRNCIRFEKTGHLQDELGDRIQINHPISGQSIKTFVSKLTRIFVSPAGTGNGKFIDSIIGWKI